jgi:hypothetical protein
VLDLHEKVNAARAAGRRHVIEPAMREAREQAARLNPTALVADSWRSRCR